MKFKDKLVLITGGSSGIGRATALAFAKQGASIILQARSLNKLEDTAQEIKAFSEKVHFFSTDLTNSEAVQQSANEIIESIGIPDIIVNSAGLGDWLSMEESSMEHFKETIESPYLATAYTCKVFYDHMKNRGYGHIITINSAAAYFIFGRAIGYMSSRWALRGFMDAFRADAIGTGITVSAVTFAKVDSPYFTNNPISEQRIPRIARILLPETDPEGAAKVILRTAITKKGAVFNSIWLRIFAWMSQAFPGTFRWFIRVTD